MTQRAGSLSRACRDGVPHLDWALLDRLSLDLLAPGALDRTRDAAAHPEPVVRRVRDRIHLERRDVAFEDKLGIETPILSSVKERLEPDGQARWKIADPLQRQQHAGDVRLAREGVVADRQQLAVTAQQHLLMGDETR